MEEEANRNSHELLVRGLVFLGKSLRIPEI